ncbi:MAG: hypothetical protein R3E39_26495 [Anaerolineae bacterium]
MHSNDTNKPYHLEIYMPNSADDVWGVFTSDTPFMSISAGDIINPGTWDGGAIPGTTVLRAINVEHIIWNSQHGIKHKICVFTEEIEDTKNIRLSHNKVATH